jgi:hypothetical protein
MTMNSLFRNERSISRALNHLNLRHRHLLRVGSLVLLLALAACQQDGGGNGY